MHVRFKRRGALGLGIWMLTVLCLISCRGSGAGQRYYSYLYEPHELLLSGELDGMPVQARLRYAARQTNTSDCPDFTLTYLSPSSLAGVCVQYEAATKELCLTLAGQTLSVEKTGLDDVAQALLCEAAVQSSHKATREDGTQTLTLQTMGGTSMVLDAATGYPISLRHNADGRVIEIKHMEWEKEE